MEQPLAIRIFHWLFFGTALIVIFTSFLKVFRIGSVFGWPETTVSFYHQTSGFAFFYLIVFRVYYSLITGSWRQEIPTINEFKTAPAFLKYFSFLTETKPPVFPKYNIGQKLVFLSWAVLVILQTITGVILMFPIQTKPVVSFLFGSLQMVRLVHFLLFAYFFITVLIHIYLVFTEDPAKLQAMFTGYLKKKGEAPEKS